MTNKFEEVVQECVWPSFDDNGKFVTTEFDNKDALLKYIEKKFGKRGLLFAQYEIYCIETNDHFSEPFIKITDEMLNAFLGDSSNKQARINLRHECEQDKDAYNDVVEYWEMINDVRDHVKGIA